MVCDDTLLASRNLANDPIAIAVTVLRTAAVPRQTATVDAACHVKVTPTKFAAVLIVSVFGSTAQAVNDDDNRRWEHCNDD